MAFEHPSNLPGAYDRARSNAQWDGLVFAEGHFAQGAELNEMQTMIGRRVNRVGDLVARDGDRISGADIVVDTGAGRISLASGAVYVRGDTRPVPARVIEGVALAGDVTVGVRLTTSYVTEEDDPTLVGLAPGSLGEGEPGAARMVESIAWALATDGAPGDFFGVYLVRDGSVIDQAPPPNLSNVNAAIAIYDRDANGSYVVEGCRVTALGVAAGAQVFSISEGVANIFGFKRTRATSLRHAEVEAWDVETVDAEPHTFDGAGSATIALNHGPIDTINSVVITKQATETVVRGSPNNSSDALGHSGVTLIVSVTQGATTYVSGADYTLAADRVNWAPGGAEPAVGSSYQVTYRYLDAVAVDSQTTDTITVSGGVTGSAVIVGYDWRLPRVDLVCLDQSGGAVYLKGTSARTTPIAPISPVTLLPLAEVTNDWRGTPKVVNTGVRSMHYSQIWRMWNRLVDALDLIALERLKSDIDTREPVAKKGVFVDPCVDDSYRDSGVAQDAAVFLGSIQLAIDPTFHPVEIAAPIMLLFTEEVIVSQPLKTGCMRINPYQVFDPLPARIGLTPSMDFWTESRDEWLSPQTQAITNRRIGWGHGNPTVTRRTTVADVLVDEREELVEFLRQIEVAFHVQGFGPGETLAALTFDGVNVMPAGLVADAAGELSGTFIIPPGIVAGTKEVAATGGSGTTARALFVGQGEIDIDVMQRQTLVETTITYWTDPLAQTWALPAERHVVGVNLHPCTIGDPANAVVLDLVPTATGLPTQDVIASAYKPMLGVEVGDTLAIRWRAPVYTPAEVERAFVVKTDDGYHALSIATLGDFDATLQRWVSAQPYSVGTLLSSANTSTWTPHQAADLAFELVAARFGPTTRTVPLGSFNLVDCSDLIILATVELPTGDCSFRFELVRAGGEVLALQPNQAIEFATYVTETVQLRAVLTGTVFVSPTLFPGVMLVAGKMRASGSYVSRQFAAGAGVRVSANLKALLPAGSSVTVDMDAGGVWTPVPLTHTEALNDGWAEREHTIDPLTGAQTRLRLTLNGTPAARPSLADVRAVSI
ncbi:DUF4815 domain-containing protein [Xanthobacter sp. 126]|uniref:DUF4815 domain-containing protein n=1 Tax=Xanthobacter sp. 126 TaxID=1131814 RepID=UPI00045E8C15|nr:DUF4815 domain-containing protein [Xanthobacter sp. 126]